MTIAELLDRARQTLLDLSTRNRLLSLPEESSAARVVHVHDERSEEIFKLLVRDQKSMTFVAGRMKAGAKPSDDVPEADIAELPQVDDPEVDELGVAARHRDLKLQTTLTSEGLQKRLLGIYYDARTLLEEQGVNILFLALGQLEWYEREDSDVPRRAPLILIPVRIERKAAGVRFSIAWDQEDLNENLSLAARLKEFGLKLPSFEYSEEFDATDYLTQVERAVAPMPRFAVHRHDIALAFFSFAKFLMYRDLDSGIWPADVAIDEHQKIKGLLKEGFPNKAAPLASSSNIDEVAPPAKRIHVVDADSSQSLVIAEIERGDDLVVQGPPGTGKSQTITNIIASAVSAGKKVLFVAEKLAALEVVKRNLERIHLDQIALELHSNKARKRAVLEELGRTLGLSLEGRTGQDGQSEALTNSTEALNFHAHALHTPIGKTGLSAFQIIGTLTNLGERQIAFSQIHIAEPENITGEAQASSENALFDLSRRVEQIGLPANHLWRGVRLDSILPNEAHGIGQTANGLALEFEGLTSAGSKIAAILQQPAASTILELEDLCALGIELGKLPRIDRASLTSAVWSTGLEQVKQLIADGSKFSALMNRGRNSLRDDAYDQDWKKDRSIFLEHGQSVFRFLRGDYRTAIRHLKLASIQPPPKDFPAKCELFDRLDEIVSLKSKLESQYEFAASAFGSLWKGRDSDWPLLIAQLKWVAGFNGLRSKKAKIDVAARVSQSSAVGTLSQRLSERLTKVCLELDTLLNHLHLDITAAFDTSKKEEVTLSELINRMKSWSAGTDLLSAWIKYHCAAERVRAGLLSPFYMPIANGDLAPASAHDAFKQAFFNSLLRLAVRNYPALAHFEGKTHAELVDRFRQLDLQYLQWTRLRVVKKHLDALPRTNTGVGALGTLHREINKRSNHMALRKLLSQAGSVIQEIKPVFMMSPLSVAQFLAPGAVKFDLLVIDEASQIEPIDAYGAIARCAQIVVVGDDKQLPPTRFFSRMTGNVVDEDESDEQESAGIDVDSILGLCRARGVSEQMLRWHYRSRHHSLIAVSNKEFYESGLFIPPSPQNLASASGLKLRRVNGIYDRGKTRQNTSEAAAIAQAVIDFAEKSPGKTLGVVAFSEAQKQAILDRLESARAARPDLEDFFAGGKTEPFFVKNLENVQGDERDVIFISVGYGRDPNGYMAMAFGPLSANGGERRLNVLISRAKWRCEVFSSITADDIDLERTKSRGAAALKVYLKFAETGRLDIAKSSEREMDSIFEAAVKSKLEQAGHTIHAQVGMAGFFIDLAVVDPEKPGRYILGIECDGAAYHSSRSARDRDRLRQAVLEDHGWRIYRIWSADWLHRPKESLRNLLSAVDNAIAESRDEPEPIESAHAALPVEIAFTPLNSAEYQIDVKEASPYEPYCEASFAVPRTTQIHELATDQLCSIVVHIVEIEQPIHREEIVQRVRNLWALGRAGSRIQDAVASAINLAQRNDKIKLEDQNFFVMTKGGSSRVRNRLNAASRTLKEVEMLPPSEVRHAIVKLLQLSHRATLAEISLPVARWLGFQQTSAQLKESIRGAASDLISSARIRQQGEALLLPDKAVTNA